MSQERGPDIHLYIDRLILDGLPVDGIQTPQVQMAVEAELTRLLVENGIAASLQAGGAMPSLRANEIQATAASNPAQMGSQIAQSIYSGIGNKP
jgi:hypothetical protein